jgi:hypothetical protein
VLALDGEDLRDLPLSLRKTNLERLLRGRPDGIVVTSFEQGEIGLSTCFAPPAIWGGKAWCRSGAIDRTAPVTFHTIAWSSFAPPKCRMSLGQSQARR